MDITLNLKAALCSPAPIQGTVFVRQVSTGALYTGILTVPLDFPSDDRFAAIVSKSDGTLLLAPLESDPLPTHCKGGDVTWLLQMSMWASNGTRAFLRDTGHQVKDGKLVIVCGAGLTIPFAGSEQLIDFAEGLPAATRSANSIGRQPGQILRTPSFQTALGRVGLSGSVHLEVAELFDQHHAAMVNGTEKQFLASLSPDQRIHLTTGHEPEFARFLKSLANAGALTSSKDLVTAATESARNRNAATALQAALSS